MPLVRAWQIFRGEAYQQVSGLCRTVREPSMSANPGKVQILGVTEIKGEKVIELRFIQGRNRIGCTGLFMRNTMKRQRGSMN